MANYKLTNDYWETSGIYDIGQGKTQRQFNADIKASAESIGKTETETAKGKKNANRVSPPASPSAHPSGDACPKHRLWAMYRVCAS